MLGCRWISLDDVVHALLADSSAAPGRSHGEIPWKSAPGKFGPASPASVGKLGNLWIYLQSVQAYLMMPFAGIFFAGVLWKRTTNNGVIACLVTACVVCPLLMANRRFHFLPFMDHSLLQPWLHAAFVAFIVCMFVLVTVSLITTPVDAERLRMTTISNWKSLLISEHNRYLVWLGLLLAICACLWLLVR